MMPIMAGLLSASSAAVEAVMVALLSRIRDCKFIHIFAEAHIALEAFSSFWDSGTCLKKIKWVECDT